MDLAWEIQAREAGRVSCDSAPRPRNCSDTIRKPPITELELMAPIQGLLALKEACAVEVTTDSEYVRQGITQWIIRWKRRHWWKKNRPVRNADLWMELDELVGMHQTNWLWTKGHAAHEDNNRCDWLAQNAARTQTSCWPDGRPNGALRLNLGPEYVPPNPQGGLFGEFEVGEDEEEGDPG